MGERQFLRGGTRAAGTVAEPPRSRSPRRGSTETATGLGFFLSEKGGSLEVLAVQEFLEVFEVGLGTTFAVSGLANFLPWRQ